MKPGWPGKSLQQLLGALAYFLRALDAILKMTFRGRVVGRVVWVDQRVEQLRADLLNGDIGDLLKAQRLRDSEGTD